MIKNYIKTFITIIITTIVVGSISVYATSQYFAHDITFMPISENFKKENGEAIDNVEDALNELYGRIDFSDIFENVIGNNINDLLVNNSYSEIKKDNKKYVFSRTNSNNAAISFINKKIDPAKYAAIVLTVKGISGEGSLIAGLSNNLNNTQVKSWDSNFIKYYEVQSKASIQKSETIIMDLSDITGEQYLGFGGKNYICSYQIEKIILIKK